MAALTSFFITVIMCTGGLYLATYIYAFFEPRARDWPAFWAGAMVMICAFPVLGFVFSKFSFFPSIVPIDKTIFHTPLSNVEIVATEIIARSPVAQFDVADLGVGTLFISYFIGLVFHGFRLWKGRRKALEIANNAVPTAGAGKGVWETETLVSPFILAPFGKPSEAKIIIPSCFSDNLSEAEYRTVMEHERAHIIRRDDEVGLALRCLLVFFWINPVCHLFFRKWQQSTEIQCDAAVTRQKTPEMRLAYAETLIKALHITAERVRQYPTASFSNPRLRNIKMRIDSIVSGPTPIFKRAGHKVTLFISMAVITLSGATLISTTAAADPGGKTGVKVNDISFMLTGRLTSSFGQMRDIFNEGKMTDHHGIDVAAPIGTPIYAPADGLVLAATDLYDGKPAYGTVVVLKTANDTTTLLSHLNSYLVQKGDVVKKGDMIALVGNSGKSTAPHVHIETRRSGKRVDPMGVWSFKP